MIAPAPTEVWSYLYDQALKMRASGNVKRWHAIITLREQNVASHSYNVAILAYLIAPAQLLSTQLLLACLLHDAHERSIGDIPSTAKWAFPPLGEAIRAAEKKWEDDNGVSPIMDQLSAAEQLILQVCDYLELLLWSTEELFAGNGFAIEAIKNIVPILDEMRAKDDFPYRAKEIYDNARQQAHVAVVQRGYTL